MTMSEFQQIWNANGGFDTIMAIIFDNSGRWIMDRKIYTPYEEEDRWGNMRVVPNHPKAYLKPGTDEINWMPVNQYLEIDAANECLKMKRYFVGADRHAIETEGSRESKMYGIEVRHVENVQLMIFADNDNKDFAQHLYPLDMT